MVCSQIRTDFLSVLIWVQNVCKGYQQATKVTDKGPEKQNNFEIHVGGLAFKRPKGYSLLGGIYQVKKWLICLETLFQKIFLDQLIFIWMVVTSSY